MTTVSTAPCEQKLSLLLSSSLRRRKKAGPESHQASEVEAALTSGLVNLVFPPKTRFFKSEDPFID